MSFNERLEEKALAEISDACADKAARSYESCANDVRRKVFAESWTGRNSLRYSSWDKNMGNVNRNPGAGETAPGY
jgi:hypothetical protein